MYRSKSQTFIPYKCLIVEIFSGRGVRVGVGLRRQDSIHLVAEDRTGVSLLPSLTILHVVPRYYHRAAAGCDFGERCQNSRH